MSSQTATYQAPALPTRVFQFITCRLLFLPNQNAAIEPIAVSSLHDRKLLTTARKLSRLAARPNSTWSFQNCGQAQAWFQHASAWIGTDPCHPMSVDPIAFVRVHDFHNGQSAKEEENHLCGFRLDCTCPIINQYARASSLSVRTCWGDYWTI